MEVHRRLLGAEWVTAREVLQSVLRLLHSDVSLCPSMQCRVTLSTLSSAILAISPAEPAEPFGRARCQKC